MSNEDFNGTEKQYDLERQLSFVYVKLQGIREMIDIAVDIKEPVIFQLLNFKSEEYVVKMEHLQSELDLETRKNKLGLTLLKGGKMLSAMSNKGFDY